MALTQSQKDQIARIKISIEGKRKDIENLNKQKKEKNQYYSNQIKNTKETNSKRSLRQTKISWLNSINKSIELKKQELLRLKNQIISIKK
jgi:hypothetical protein